MANYRSNYSKKPPIIAGAAKLGVIALATALVITGVVGLSGKAYGRDGIQVGVSGAGVVELSDKAPPEPTQAPTTPSNTGDDAVSMNALVGTWGYRSGGSEHFYWNFNADGSFAYYRASNVETGSWFTRHETFTKGKYHVKDYVIEFYDCHRDSHSGASWKYFSVGSYLALQYDIPFDTPLEAPKETDNVSMMFEFTDSMTLRIISDCGIVWGNYDIAFQYMANSHNVAIPTHRIPVTDLTWPTDKLPPEVLEYTSGSIREIDDTSHNRTVHIYIERTTREALVDYGKRLIQSGWERGAFTDLLDGTGDTLWLDKGGIHLHLNMSRDDFIEIAFWYGIGFEKYW